MAIYEYQVPTDTPRFDFSAELDGSTFLFHFDYQAKSDRYFFSMYDANGAPIRRGMKVLAGWNVLRLMRTDARPIGGIYFLDLASHLADPPALRDLGRRVLFFYVGKA